MRFAGLDFDVRRYTPTAAPLPPTDTASATAAPGTPASPLALLPFPVALGRLSVEETTLAYADERPIPRPTYGAFDPAAVDVEDLGLVVTDFVGGVDTVGFSLGGLRFREASGFELREFSATEVALVPSRLRVDGLNLNTLRSHLGDHVDVRIPEGESWASALQSGRAVVDLEPSVLSVSELVAFVPTLGEVPLFVDYPDGEIAASGTITGNLAKVSARDLALDLPDGTHLRGDVDARNLATPRDAWLFVEVDELATSVAKVEALLPQARLPPRFRKLGELDFSGRFTGFLADFVAYGDLRTDLGRATLDTRFVRRPDAPPSYSGEAALYDFQLGRFLDQPRLGSVSAAFDIREGRGLTSETLALSLAGAIEEITFRDYTYRDVRVNGDLSPAGYTGSLVFADEHADLDFEGRVSLGDEDGRFDFDLAVRKLDLAPLRLSEEPWSFAGEVRVQSNTLDLDNLVGQVQIRDLRLGHADGRRYTLRNVLAVQRVAPDGTKLLSVDSPVAAVDISGDYRLRTVFASIQAAFAEGYPELYAYTNLGPAPASDSLATRVSVSANVGSADSLLAGLAIPVSQLAGTQLTLTLDTERDELDFSLSSGLPRVAGVELKNLGVDVRAQSGEAELEVRTEQLGVGNYVLSGLGVYGEYADGDLRYSVRSDTSSRVLGEVSLAGDISLADTAVAFRLDPTSFLDVSGERWTVRAGNRLSIGRRRVTATDVVLESGRRFVEVETQGERGVNVLVRQFDLGLLNAYLNPEKVQIAGEFDAFFSSTDVFAREGVNFSASVDTLTVNDVDWGALQVLAQLPDTSSAATLYTTFSRLGQQAVLDVAVAPTDDVRVGGAPRPAGYLDARLTSTAFDMSFLSYFIPGITDLRGELGADLHVFGTPDDLTPEGGVLVDKSALTIDYLKTRYYIDSQFVSINGRLLDATGRQIRDKFGNTATITGGLTHDRLLTWGLDVSIATDRLYVLATGARDNPVYYGDAYADGRVAFTGPFNQTDIDIDVAALGGSRVVFPVTGSSAEEELRFIEFVDRADTAAVAKEEETARFVRGINLDMDIAITPAAELLVVFDEAAGDILSAQGTGQVDITVRRTGSYSMFGNFDVDRGEYLFTLLNVVNKPFTIREGGTIVWDGSPFEAKLDLSARYEGLQAKPQGLIEDFLNALRSGPGGSAGADLVEQASIATPVDLFLELSGNLQRPDLDFSIDLPEVQGELRGYVNSKLALIRQDENLLNRQVFGLIVIGQFIPDYNDLGGGGAGYIGFNTISELFSSQLSFLLTELFSSLAGDETALSGIDIDINLQNNSSLTGDNAARFGVNDVATQLRTFFFQDRLEVGLGVNVGQNGVASGQLTAGRFEVSYAISEDRRLRLKTFASTNVDIQNSNRNRAGVGLSWRREFDSFGELFSQVGKAKRQEGMFGRAEGR